MKLKELPLSIFHSLRLRYGSRTQSRESLPVTVSLTSIPSRLSTLDVVISSLLAQSHVPQSIILWLNDTLKDRLPERLTSLEGDVFKIQFCEGTSSYRKLLPTLKQLPDSIIVTCDDDLIYPSNWLINLYHGHEIHPESVISQVARKIARDENGVLLPYKEWSFIRYECHEKNLLPIGYGGVLYPLGAFSEDVFNKDIYMKLSPKADDLWFKAMAILNNKLTYCVSEKAKPIPLPRTQKNSLGEANIKQDKNRSQWQALCDYYPSLNDLD